MKVNNREYGYTIEPNVHYLLVEIYNVYGGDVHIPLLNKNFGKWYRGLNESDYKEAKIWAENQMKWIYEANSVTSDEDKPMDGGSSYTNIY